MFQDTPPQWFASDAGVWRECIDRLEQRRWCLPPKAAALRAWTGCEMVFDRTDALQAFRGLHHFKFDLHDGRVTAKAYAIMRCAAYPAARGR